jgi:hypothetical protein
MSYSYNWSVVLLLLLLTSGTTLSRNAMLGLGVTFGVLLALLLITTLVTTLVKVALPMGSLKHGLLKLRGGRYR